MNKWSICNLKQHAKEMVKLNYWKCVIVGLLITILLGGFSFGFNGVGSGLAFKTGSNDTTTYAVTSTDGADSDDIEATLYELDEELSEVTPMLVVVFIVAYLVALTIAVLFSTFLLNPFRVGVYSYFSQMHNAPADLNHLVHGFKSNYKSNVKTLFMRDLFTFLWSLLFIIPGIIKSYSYRMVPYIVAENPEISYKDALAQSTQMMKGHKFHTFGLDMSFFGWFLLSVITLNIVGIFYAFPYFYATDAELYHSLKPQKSIAEMN